MGEKRNRRRRRDAFTSIRTSSKDSRFCSEISRSVCSICSLHRRHTRWCAFEASIRPPARSLCVSRQHSAGVRQGRKVAGGRFFCDSRPASIICESQKIRSGMRNAARVGRESLSSVKGARRLCRHFVLTPASVVCETRELCPGVKNRSFVAVVCRGRAAAARLCWRTQSRTRMNWASTEARNCWI